MAIVIESTSTGTASSSTTMTITKPTGLSVGDLMVAYVFHHSDFAALTFAWDVPSGWTQDVDDVGESGGGDRMYTASFYRVADAADVLATDFDFTTTATATGSEKRGILYRVSGTRTDTQFGVSDTDNVNNSATPVFSLALSPPQDNVLYIAHFVSGVVPITATDVTLNGVNPTWTSDVSLTTSVGSILTLSVFTSIVESAEPSITTMTPTVTGGAGTTYTIAGLSVYLGKTDVSGTVDFIEAGDEVFNVTGRATVKGNLDFIEEDSVVNDISASFTTNLWTDILKPISTAIAAVNKIFTSGDNQTFTSSSNKLSADEQDAREWVDIQKP